MEELRERLSEEDIRGGFDLEDFLRQHKTPVFLGLIGLLFLSAGIFFFFKISQPEDKIEIISGEDQKSGQLVVDLGGAVEKPGVYELPAGSRLQDLLIEAGGLSSEADRVWVEKNLNRAQRLTDGAKIYIPGKGDLTSPASTQTSAGFVGGAASTAESSGLVNINNAVQAELENLWGIGPATAQKIIDNRPYQAVNDLLTKKILKSNVYQRIADQLTVW